MKFWVVLILIHSVHAVYRSNEERMAILGTVDLDPRFIATVEPEVGGDGCTVIEAQMKTLCETAMGTGSDANTTLLEFDDELCFIHFNCDADYVGGDELQTIIDVITDISYDAPVISEAVGSWGIDRIDQESLPLSGSFSPSHTGAGVNVYIIDTGIYATHNEFSGRASYGADYVNEGVDYDLNGHGTHCAGTAVGTTYGVARSANVIGVKVLSARGGGSISNVINGITWAVKNQKNNFGGQSAVLSLSLGGGRHSLLNKVTRAASKSGHIVTVAAGNQGGDDACDYSPAGAGGAGAQNGVITVASSTNKDRRSDFSNIGKCVDIFAPGSSIKSSWKGSNTATNTISGTSMATPHVAGVAAVLLEKHGHDKVAAQAELLGGSVLNKISNGIAGVPLLQVPTYTGPPTPPTVAPTPGPQLPDPVLTAGGTYIKRWVDAEFGIPISVLNSKVGPLARTPDKGCSAHKSNEYKGMVVMVERGDCTFHKKVKHLVDAGAIAVLITQDSPSMIGSPKAAPGDVPLSVPIAMISRADGWKLDNHITKTAYWGLDPKDQPIATPPPTSNGAPPTPQPSSGPVDSAPTFNRYFANNGLSGGFSCATTTKSQFINRRLRRKTIEDCAKACVKKKGCTHINYRDSAKYNNNCQLIKACTSVDKIAQGFAGYAFVNGGATPAPTSSSQNNFQKYFENNKESGKYCKRSTTSFYLKRYLDVTIEACADQCIANTECEYFNYHPTSTNGRHCDLIHNCKKKSGSSFNLYRKVGYSPNANAANDTNVFGSFFTETIQASSNTVCDSSTESQVLNFGLDLTKDQCATRCVSEPSCTYINYDTTSISPCTLLRVCDIVTKDIDDMTQSYINADPAEAATDDESVDESSKVSGAEGAAIGMGVGIASIGIIFGVLRAKDAGMFTRSGFRY